MTNITAQVDTDPSDGPGEPSTEPITVSPASLRARALAAFIDYLIVSSVLLYASQQGLAEAYLLGIGFACVYYGLGNSAVTGGQTVGKKLFGLRVLSIAADSSPTYPSITQSMARFWSYFGIAMVLNDIPAAIYRSVGYVGDTTTLELHMLFVSIYTIANITSALFDGNSQALHDRICATLVVSQRQPIGTASFRLQIDMRNHCRISDNLSSTTAALLAGALLGGSIWWLSISHPPQVDAVNRHRYAIEQQFEIRLVGVQYARHTLGIQVVTLQATASDKQALTSELFSYLRETNALAAEVQSIDVTFASQLEPWSRYVLSTETGEITQRTVEDTPFGAN